MSVETYVVYFECVKCGTNVYPSKYSSRAEPRKRITYDLPTSNPSEYDLLRFILPKDLGLPQTSPIDDILKTFFRLDPVTKNKILKLLRNRYDQSRIQVINNIRAEADKKAKELMAKARSVTVNETPDYIEVVEDRYPSIVEETGNTIIYKCPRCGSELAVVTLPESLALSRRGGGQ